MTEQSQALEQRTPTTTLDWLAGQTGVNFFNTPDGKLGIAFNPEFTQSVNFLAPISQVVQSDPNWSPAPRIVRLDPKVDAYANKGKQQLTKQGLAKLAQLAQIERYDTKWDYMGGAGLSCTVYARQRGQDGLWRLTDATKTVFFQREEEKIRRSARSDADANKQIDEFYEHVARKIQTKAWNACVRELLALPNGYTMQELQRPFFVIGYVFTPDYSNPHVNDIMRLHSGQATDELYGGHGEPETPQALGPSRDSRALPMPDPDDFDDDFPDASEVNGGVPEGVDPATGELHQIEGPPGDSGDVSPAVPPQPDAIPQEPSVETPADVPEWDDADPEPVDEIPMPKESFVPAKGPFAGKQAFEIVGTAEGRLWLANAVAKMRNLEKQQQGLVWLSFGLQREVTVDDMEALIKANGEPK